MISGSSGNPSPAPQFVAPMADPRAGITPSRQIPDIDIEKVDPQLREAAEGMEAMFVDYLMQTMRKTVPKNDFSMDSPATQIYQGMADSEMAQKAAKSGRGIGLAQQIIEYTMASQGLPARGKEAYNHKESEGSGVNRTGGTNAGRPSGE